MKLILAAMAMMVLVTVAAPAEARLCVPVWNEFEECHPADGSEPPSWCGEYDPYAAIVDAWNAVSTTVAGWFEGLNR